MLIWTVKIDPEILYSLTLALWLYFKEKDTQVYLNRVCIIILGFLAYAMLNCVFGVKGVI